MMFCQRFIPILFCLAFLFSSTVSFAQISDEAKKDARKIWLKGFEYFEKGEKSRKNGQFREALTLFKESLSHFDTIKAKYPKWNTALINYRIKICKGKVDLLKGEFAKKNIKFTETETDKENLLLKSRLATLEKELKDTKSQLDTTYASLEAARREAARNVKVSDQVEELLKEKVALTNRIALLEDQQKNRSGSAQAKDPQVDQASLDKALLQIETLKKDKGQLITILENEKQKYELLSQKKKDLSYKLKMIEKSGQVDQQDQKQISKKIVVLEETIHQHKKEKEDLAQKLATMETKSKKAEETVAKLRDEIKKARLDGSKDSATIVKQLQNDNELLLKSLETANVKLAEKSKQIKDLEKAQADIKVKKDNLAQTLAGIDESREKLLKDLKMLNKKVFIADTITKKQDQTILKQKDQYEKLKKDFSALSVKNKELEGQQDEFTSLAKQLVNAESQNNKMVIQLKKVKEENKHIVTVSKKAEIDLMKAQADYKKLVNQMTKLEDENLRLKVNVGKESLALKTKNKEVFTELAKLKKSNDDYDKKIDMLTDELVAMNSKVVEKDKKIQELEAKSASKEPAIVAVKTTPEPELTKTAQFLALKRENNQLLARLNQVESELRKHENVSIKVVTSAAQKSVDPKKLQEMLAKANAAEHSNKKEAATWYYAEILKLQPENIKALSRLGSLAAASGNNKKAIPLLLHATRLDPENIDLLTALTFCYIQEGKYYEALAAASRAAAKDSKDPTIQRYLGKIFSNFGWNDAAEQQFRNSFKLDPTSSETAFNAAVHIIRTAPNRKDEAKLWYERAIQLGAKKDPMMDQLFK